MVLGFNGIAQAEGAPPRPFPRAFPTCPFVLRFHFQFILCSDLGAPRLGCPQLIALVPLSINTPTIIADLNLLINNF